MHKLDRDYDVNDDEKTKILIRPFIERILIPEGQTHHSNRVQVGVRELEKGAMSYGVVEGACKKLEDELQPLAANLNDGDFQMYHDRAVVRRMTVTFQHFKELNH